MKNAFTGILAKGYAACSQECGVHVSTIPSIRGCQGAHCVPQTPYADVLTLSTSAVVVVVESLSHARLFVTPWTATRQASLSFTISGVCSNSCPLRQWCHPAISSSVTLFSSCLQSFPASRSFPMSQFFPSGGQSTGASASASVLPMNIQDWFPLGLTGLISLQSKGLSRVFSNTTVQKHQFFGTQPSLWSKLHICTWLLEKP